MKYIKKEVREIKYKNKYEDEEGNIKTVEEIEKNTGIRKGNKYKKWRDNKKTW